LEVGKDENMKRILLSLAIIIESSSFSQQVQGFDTKPPKVES
jgi:hypothetical protein